MRKTLIIIIGIIVVLIIGWLIYYFVFRNTALSPSNLSPTGPLTTSEPNSTSSSQTAENAVALKILSLEPVFDYWTASSTQEIFYVALDGKISKIGAPENNYLSNQVIENLNLILASPDSQKIVAAFGDPRRPQLSIFDLISNAWTPLPAGIKSLSFSPEGKRLAALMTQNGKTDLVIIDLTKKTGTLKTVIKNFALQDLKIDWLRPQEIIFSEKPSALTSSSAWRLDLTNLAFTKIIPPGNGLLLKWLKNDLGLKFQNQKSSLINWAGQIINDFPFLALPDKCAWRGDTLYCFLFSDGIGIGPKTNWPDDYLQKAVYTKDALYKLDLNDLTKPQLIFTPNEQAPIDATILKILGNQILFINRYDNHLYSLEISE
jgi:hypothetical protein